MTDRRTAKQGLSTIAAIVGSSALNYGYLLVLGRVLSPEGYGAYGSFAALFMLLAALPVAYQQAAARRPAGSLTRAALGAGALAAATLLLGAGHLGPLLGIPAGWVAAFALTLPALAVLGAWRGAAQRDGRAAAFGLSLLAEHGLKITLTFPLLLLLPGPAAAVAATLAGVLLALPLVRPAQAQGRGAPRDRAVAPLALAAASQSALLYGDVLLGGMLLGAPDAGAYAAAATLARAVFFAGWAVQVAAFPAVARGSGPQPRLLATALLATALLAGLPALLLSVWPQACAALAFGPELGAAVAPLLAPCALATLLLTLGGTVLNHLLASGDAASVGRSAALYLGGVAALALLALTFPPSASSLALAALVGKGLLLPASFLVLPSLPWRPMYVLR